MLRDLADVHGLHPPPHRHGQDGPLARGVEQEVHEVVELGDPQQGHRQPGGQQHLLGGELRAVVAVRDPVHPDDRDVDQVPEPVAVDRLHQATGAGHVDLPRIPWGSLAAWTTTSAPASACRRSKPEARSP
ncbi:hypothetical protein [Blastococcus brunescens]|uniref:hypothetical protein n=1 Tax=Blastococcus brunescens TaxID=1564165 RepID=UPI003BEF4236